MLLSDFLERLLVCPVCKRDLVDPTTLSCGSTVCQSCVPPPNIYEQQQQHRPHQSFLCPVQQCKRAAHLFGPNNETHVDEAVQQLCQLKSSIQSPSPGAKLIKHDSSIRETCIEIICCSKCFQVMNEPITMHCGHVYCRLCLLKLRITSDTCIKCLRPLPRYNHIQNEGAPNNLLQTFVRIVTPAGRPSSTADVASLSSSSETKNANMYISGLVILPGQQARLPIFAPPHLRMLQRAVFSCEQYKGICIATVHRARPNISQYGTIVQIVSIEHQTGSSVVMDVVGRARFRVTNTHATDNLCDPSILAADFQLISEDDDAEMMIFNADIYRSAQTIHNFLTKMGTIPQPTAAATAAAAGTPPSASSFLNASSDCLMGPLWFETMQRIHGPLPSPNHPAAVGWWAAVVLPVSGAERYAILRTVALVDRLALITSWITQLESQWNNRSHRAAIEQKVNQ